jgi:hypothetical protein
MISRFKQVIRGNRTAFSPESDVKREYDTRLELDVNGSTQPDIRIEPDNQLSSICQSCSGISSTVIQSPGGYVLHMSPSSLVSSSRSCSLCRLVRIQLQGAIDRIAVNDSLSWDRHTVRDERITLRGHRTPGKIWLHMLGLHLGELQWFAYPSELMTT